MPIDVVPNGIPRFDEAPSCLPAIAGKEGGWPVIVFVGHLGYAPNVTAVVRLATAILPEIRQTLPSAKLLLAGRDPKREVMALAVLPGVELAADPVEMSSLLLRSHISVVPLSAGGGTRIKILEAMAWGLPVVASSIAAEGLEFTNGSEILMAETDDAFAKSVIALSSEPERFERQRGLAYEKARFRFGPSAIEEAVRRGLGQTNAGDDIVMPFDDPSAARLFG